MNKLNYILIAEDDADDQLLIKSAFSQAGLDTTLQFTNNGEELIGFLKNKSNDEPSFILLDLNMPKMDGNECLSFIRANTDLRHIPIIVFTTSSLKENIQKAYQLGANSYITKPTSFNTLKDLARLINDYWLNTIKLPHA